MIFGKCLKESQEIFLFRVKISSKNDSYKKILRFFEDLENIF